MRWSLLTAPVIKLNELNGGIVAHIESANCEKIVSENAISPKLIEFMLSNEKLKIFVGRQQLIFTHVASFPWFGLIFNAQLPGQPN